MTYDPKADRAMLKAIERLADAAAEHAFIGTIPVWSSDRSEQEAINQTRGAITGERKRAETCLLRLIAKRVEKGGK